MIIFKPWYKLQNSLRYMHKGVLIYYHRALDTQEKTQIINCIDDVQTKFETIALISRSCIIDNSYSNLIVMLSNDIDEKYFNARYGTSYKKISGLARGKLIIVDIASGIQGSALAHELCHVILDCCSIFSSEVEQHQIINRFGY